MLRLSTPQRGPRFARPGQACRSRTASISIANPGRGASKVVRAGGWLPGIPTVAALGPGWLSVFLYVIWPLTVLGGPLVYAFVYQWWLAADVQDAELAAVTPEPS